MNARKPRWALHSARDWWRLAAWVWGVVLLIVAIRVFVQGPREHSVFFLYVNAAQRWMDGRDLYTADNFQFRYSPLFAILFNPFTFLPEWMGGILWRLFNAAAFVAGFSWWWRRVAGWRGDARALPIMLLLSLPLALLSLNNGQVNPLMTGLILCAFAATAEELWIAAALALSAAVFLKLYPLAAGLLLGMLYPRQLLWRQGAALSAGAATCLICQKPSFAAKQFVDWFEYLRGDLRFDLPPEAAYRDLRLLLNVTGLHPHPALYFALQILGGLAVAWVCGRLHFRGTDKRFVLTIGYALTACWILLLGPATESCTYVLAAPVFAWLLLADHLGARPLLFRASLFGSIALLTAALVANWFPGTTRVHGLGLHPLSMLALLGCVIYEINGAHAARFDHTGGQPGS